MTDKKEVAAELRQADFEAIHDLRRARYSQEASAIRSLQLANAGGSVALLAFLGQTWTVAQSLQMPLAISIGTMVAGLLLAVFAGFQLPSFSERRYLENHFPKEYRRAWLLYYGTIGLSLVAFVFAVLFLLAMVAHNPLHADGLLTG